MNFLKKLCVILFFISGIFCVNSGNTAKVNAQSYEVNNEDFSILSTDDLINMIIQEELEYINLFSTLEMGIEKFKVNNKYYKELLMRDNVDNILEQRLLLANSEIEGNKLILLKKIINDSGYTEDINLFALNSNSVANIYTPNGTVVQHVSFRVNGFDDNRIRDSHLNMLRDYPTITDDDYVFPANEAYNCHSYAFYSQDPLTNNVWMDYPNSYLDDYTYVVTDVIRPGDIVCYWSYGHGPDGYSSPFISHSAIVVSGTANINYNPTLSDVTLISKWGMEGVYKHEFDECPYGPTEDISFTCIKAYRPRTTSAYSLSNKMNNINIERTIKHNNTLKYGLYELNVDETSDYLINISADNALDIRLYNSNMNLLPMHLIQSNNNLYNYCETLAPARYYLRVAYLDILNTGDILVNIRAHNHSYNFSYEQTEMEKHKAYCDCGLNILDYHTFSNSICIYCGHTHLFTKWKYFNDISHVECCSCGLTGSIKESHYIRVEDIGKTKAFCLGCKAKLDLSGDIAIAPMPSSLAVKVSVNGSYILPSGLVVLQETDITKYEDGTLVFYDKDKVPQIS